MAKGYHHLAYEDRCQIYALKKSGMSHADIAHQLNVDKSTITREIRRNSGDGGYRHKQVIRAFRESTTQSEQHAIKNDTESHIPY